jgi:hypothetical protein
MPCPRGPTVPRARPGLLAQKMFRRISRHDLTSDRNHPNMSKLAPGSSFTTLAMKSRLGDSLRVTRSSRMITLGAFTVGDSGNLKRGFGCRFSFLCNPVSRIDSSCFEMAREWPGRRRSGVQIKYPSPLSCCLLHALHHTTSCDDSCRGYSGVWQIQLEDASYTEQDAELCQ